MLKELLKARNKKRKRPTKNKLKTVNKTAIGSYISTVTLNVNRLNAPTKKHRPAGWMKTLGIKHIQLEVCTSNYHITLLNPSDCR